MRQLLSKKFLKLMQRIENYSILFGGQLTEEGNECNRL